MTGVCCISVFMIQLFNEHNIPKVVGHNHILYIYKIHYNSIYSTLTGEGIDGELLLSDDTENLVSKSEDSSSFVFGMKCFLSVFSPFYNLLVFSLQSSYEDNTAIVILIQIPEFKK